MPQYFLSLPHDSAGANHAEMDPAELAHVMADVGAFNKDEDAALGWADRGACALGTRVEVRALQEAPAE